MPKRLKAAAGPFSDQDDYDRDPDTEVISIPPITTVSDSIRLVATFP